MKLIALIWLVGFPVLCALDGTHNYISPMGIFLRIIIYIIGVIIIFANNGSKPPKPS
jgi:hypothetical protein